MRVTIRSALFEDLPTIIILERQVTNAAHWSVKQYEARSNGGCLRVAESDGQISGFICASVLPGEWEIENVVVGERFRRRGIASSLLRALFDAAEKAGNPALHLEVRESNLAARQLYTKLGFRQVGRRREYYREPSEDAILYERGQPL
jgi:[ribosomal protein S18]-alanine N-acetyltransferase